MEEFAVDEGPIHVGAIRFGGSFLIRVECVARDLDGRERHHETVEFERLGQLRRALDGIEAKIKYALRQQRAQQRRSLARRQR